MEHRSDEKKSDEMGASIINEERTPTDVHTVEVFLAGSVDPVYAAKAQALNGAIGSIGMGRYQVVLLHHFSSSLFPQPKVPFTARSATRPFTFLPLYPSISCRAHYRSFAVGLVHCGWFWLFCG